MTHYTTAPQGSVLEDFCIWHAHLCLGNAKTRMQCCVQLPYPCEYARLKPWRGAVGILPAAPCFCKYNCSHFPLIEIKRQLRIKLFKLIGLLNLKHFSFFGWYHCLD